MILIKIKILQIINKIKTLKNKKKIKNENIKDVIFVLPPKKNPAWILNAICNEISARMKAVSIQLVHIDEELPLSKNYFFSHYIFYYLALQKYPEIKLGKSYVFVTHFESDKNRLSNREVSKLLALSDGVICMNKAMKSELIKLGLPEQLAHVVLGAADTSMFVPHKRSEKGSVGFISAFYERKSPEKIYEIIKLMPHRKFILLGRGWSSWKKFKELSSLPNFTYSEPNYREYPSWYSKMSVFCTVSKLEGGPIPLLEAMFCNIVPVASRTGFAPDIIKHGSNGFLFDVDAPIIEICKLIDSAFEVHQEIYEISDSCNWEIYTRSIARVMDLDFK
jgi:glycosyltransferase involved in cell wall biosynthesis